MMSSVFCAEEIDQDESSDDEELEEDDVEDVDDTIDEEKEDETVVIPKKIEPTKTETKKNLGTFVKSLFEIDDRFYYSDASTVKSIDVNSNRSVTRAQQKPTGIIYVAIIRIHIVIDSI